MNIYPSEFSFASRQTSWQTGWKWSTPLWLVFSVFVTEKGAQDQTVIGIVCHVFDEILMTTHTVDKGSGNAKSCVAKSIRSCPNPTLLDIALSSFVYPGTRIKLKSRPQNVNRKLYLTAVKLVIKLSFQNSRKTTELLLQFIVFNFYT